MPTWCYTTYVVTGEKKELCDLYEKMRSLEEREQSLVKNGFGKMWLGNLVALLDVAINAYNKEHPNEEIHIHEFQVVENRT